MSRLLSSQTALVTLALLAGCTATPDDRASLPSAGSEPAQPAMEPAAELAEPTSANGGEAQAPTQPASAEGWEQIGWKPVKHSDPPSEEALTGPPVPEPEAPEAVAAAMMASVSSAQPQEASAAVQDPAPELPEELVEEAGEALPEVAEASEDVPAQQVQPTPPTQPTSYAAQQPSTPAPREAAAPARSTSGSSLAIWSDPVFQRRFQESYLAAGSVTPRLELEDQLSLQEFQLILSPPSEDEGDEESSEEESTVAKPEPAPETAEQKAAREAQEALEEELAKRREGQALVFFSDMEEDRNAIFYYLEGNLHFARDRNKQARRAYEEAIKRFPNYRDAYKNLGLACLKSDDFAAAAHNLGRAIELGSGDSVAYGLLGLAHNENGNLIAAESAFRMASLIDAETVDWKKGLMDVVFKQKRFHEAIALLDAMIDEDPTNTKYWGWQADAYLALGQSERAAQNYEIVDRLGGADSKTLERLGILYVQSGQHEMGVEAYTRYLEMEPEAKVGAALQAARMLQINEAFDPATRLVDAIDALHGERLDLETRREVLMTRVRLAAAQGQVGEAQVGILQEIVDLDGQDGDALILLAQQWGLAGDEAQAIFFFDRAAAIEDFTPRAQLEHARFLVQLGRYRDAVPLLQSSNELDPQERTKKYLDQVQSLAARQQ